MGDLLLLHNSYHLLSTAFKREGDSVEKYHFGPQTALLFRSSNIFSYLTRFIKDL